MNADQLRAIYVHAKDQDVDLFFEPLTVAMKIYEIDTPLRQCHFLAQVGHESGELRYREELASGRAYENRADLGNTEEGDGPRFKGRGLIQLTGKSNYSQYGEFIGWELLARPELVAEDPRLSADVAGWFWAKRGLNKYADLDDVLTITKRINGGLNGIEERKRILARAKSVLMEG